MKEKNKLNNHQQKHNYEKLSLSSLSEDRKSLLELNKISAYILEELKKANTSKPKNFALYKKRIKHIFKIDSLPKITANYKFFLGGFIAGEASINVSAKKNSSAKFGLVIDPEFSITQHVNGIEYLYAALCFFQTGRIRFKSGSNATFVYRIDNRESLENKIIPFWEKYIVPFQCIHHKERAELFKQLLVLFRNKAHQDLFSFKNKILPLWDKLRKQKGQANESFKDLKEAQFFIQNHVKLDKEETKNL